MASKSANYCRFEGSGGTGVLILCEAQLGNPLYEQKASDYDAAEHCAAAVL
jgi:poly [ADP-ribose] polymerase 2/3/4